MFDCDLLFVVILSFLMLFLYLILFFFFSQQSDNEQQHPADAHRSIGQAHEKTRLQRPQGGLDDPLHQQGSERKRVALLSVLPPSLLSFLSWVAHMLPSLPSPSLSILRSLWLALAFIDLTHLFVLPCRDEGTSGDLTQSRLPSTRTKRGSISTKSCHWQIFWLSRRLKVEGR